MKIYFKCIQHIQCLKKPTAINQLDIINDSVMWDNCYAEHSESPN